MALSEIGYNDNPPVMREVRDLPGAGHRRLQATQNIAVDRLEWLLAHDKIEQYQLDAGRRLQRDCELAQIGGYSSAGSGARSTAVGPSDLPDARLDAMTRVSRARAAMVPTAWRLVELVVVENIALHVAGVRLWRHCGRGEPLGALRFALDALAAAYGLA
jgi:hypothetical protein